MFLCRALRGPRSLCSRVVFMLCRPRLVKKPSFALEIRFPHVAMKFQTDCSGLLHNKYGSLFPQSRASQSQRRSQNNVARCLLFKARRNLIFCVEMRRPGPAIRRRTDVMRAICYLKVQGARPNLIPPQYASGSVRCGPQMCRHYFMKTCGGVTQLLDPTPIASTANRTPIPRSSST